MNIGLIGDYNESVTAHKAIPVAIGLASKSLSTPFETHWINSDEISIRNLERYTGIWCVPASPYVNMENVLEVIKFARIEDIPFLGTCGGYQHAALEFARNVLGFSDAENAEIKPDAEMPLISALVCKLIEVSDQIYFRSSSNIENIYGKNTTHEEYRCGFGVNRDYLTLFDGSDMKFTGFDSEGDPRVLEIPKNRFFLGTAFQPERSALKGQPHPIIQSFLKAAANA